MTLHSLMMSQANFFLQFKSVVNKSAKLKIVTQPKSNFRLTWAPKVGLGPPQLGGLGGGCYVSDDEVINLKKKKKLAVASNQTLSHGALITSATSI